jgi:hypothetical protein
VKPCTAAARLHNRPEQLDDFQWKLSMTDASYQPTYLSRHLKQPNAVFGEAPVDELQAGPVHLTRHKVLEQHLRGVCYERIASKGAPKRRLCGAAAAAAATAAHTSGWSSGGHQVLE